MHIERHGIKIQYNMHLLWLVFIFKIEVNIQKLTHPAFLLDNGRLSHGEYLAGGGGGAFTSIQSKMAK